MPRIYNYNELSGEWEKSDGTLVGVLSGVESVNSKTGKVELTAEDVGAINENSVIPATEEMTEPVGIGEDGKLKLFANAKVKLLWKNESLKSTFVAQKVAIPGANKYHLFLVTWAISTTLDYIKDGVIFAKTNFGLMSTMFPDTLNEYRTCSIYYDEKADFSDCTKSNEHLIPYQIYGISFE